jgi:hypothetical protein
MSRINPRFIFITSAILIAGLSRLLPHPPNFTAIGAVALFGGAMYKDKKIAFLVPLMAMLLADLIIGFHNNMPAVYISFTLTVLIGLLLQRNLKFATIVLSSVLCSLLFFLITNLSVWYGNSFYPQTLGGLVLCYESALAFYSRDIFGNFFLNTIMGDLFFNGLLFGSYYLASLKFPELSKIRN